MDVGAVISGTGIPVGDTIATVTSATAGTLTTAASGNGTASEISCHHRRCGRPGHAHEQRASTRAALRRARPLSALRHHPQRYHFVALLRLLQRYAFCGRCERRAAQSSTLFSMERRPRLGRRGSSPSTTALTSPVYDNVDELVFVGDASGFLYSINSSGTVTKSLQVAVSPGIVDGPLVDISRGLSLRNRVKRHQLDLVHECLRRQRVTPKACNAVIQLPIGFGTATTFNETVAGIGTTNTLYNGSFDNQYWTSGTGTGNLYAIAGTGTPSPKLSEIKISANVL